MLYTPAFRLFLLFLPVIQIYAVGTAKIVRTGAVYSGLQTAVNAAIAGDVIELDGTFPGQMVSFKNRSNLTLQNAAGKTATLSRSITTTPSTQWYQSGLNYMTTGVSFSMFSQEAALQGRSACMYATIPDAQNNPQLLFPYNTPQDLSNFAQGPGSYYDPVNLRFYVKLVAGVGPVPTNIPITFGTSEAVIYMENSANITVRGLTIINAGWAGVYIKGGQANHDITLDNLKIYDCFRGITTDGNDAGVTSAVRPYDIFIQNCEIVNHVNPTYFTRYYGYDVSPTNEETAPQRNKGIFVCADIVSITNNHIKGRFDGMGHQGVHANINNNTIELICDDGIEFESVHSYDVQFFANYIFNSFCGVSLVSQSPGPVNIFRNVVECTWYDSDRSLGTIDHKKYGECVKMGNNWACVADNFNIYQNTFYGGSYSVWDKIGTSGTDEWNGNGTCVSDDNWTHFHFINNIFCVMDINMNSHAIKGTNYNFRGSISDPLNFYAKKDGDLQYSVAGSSDAWQNNMYNMSQPGGTSPYDPERPYLSGFWAFDRPATFVSDLATPKNLFLKSGAFAVDHGCTYAIQQHLLDVVTYTGSEIPDVGAWELSAFTQGQPYTIGCNSVKASSMREGNEVFLNSVNEQPVQLSLYPNPARQQLTVHLGTETGTTASFLFIADATGKQVAQVPVQSTEPTLLIDLEAYHLPAGVFLVKEGDGLQRTLGKFIKQ